MKRFQRRSSFTNFLRRDAGATSIEYALIAVGISISIAAIIFVLGTKVVNLFNTILGIKF